jgi:hypothetical protein
MKPNIEWNQITWYSRLLTIVFFVGVLPALSFYVGYQLEALVASSTAIEESSVVQVPVNTSPVDANPCWQGIEATTLVVAECLSGQIDALHISIHKLYQEFATTLIEDGDPTSKKYADYVSSIKKSLANSERASNEFIDNYCSALTSQYEYFGGTIGLTLYPTCVIDGLNNQKLILKRLMEDTRMGG